MKPRLFAPTFKNVYPTGKGRWYDTWIPRRQLYWNLIRRLRRAGLRRWWLDASEPEARRRLGRTCAAPDRRGHPAPKCSTHTPAGHEQSPRRDAPRHARPARRHPHALGLRRQQRTVRASPGPGSTQGNWETFRKQVRRAKFLHERHSLLVGGHRRVFGATS